VLLLLLLLVLVDRGVLVRFESTANEVVLRESGCFVFVEVRKEWEKKKKKISRSSKGGFGCGGGGEKIDVATREEEER
jgi:hypothetical protein